MKKIVMVISAVLTISVLSGCSTSKEEMFPHSGQTMNDVWAQKTGNDVPLTDVRMELRRELYDSEMVLDSMTYTRSAVTEIDNLFQRLPNPDLVMYIYPHVIEGGTPVPGYSTVFPFYDNVKYAMPGERVRGY